MRKLKFKAVNWFDPNHVPKNGGAGVGVDALSPTAAAVSPTTPPLPACKNHACVAGELTMHVVMPFLKQLSFKG